MLSVFIRTSKNKFVRTKMRLKLGTKKDLSERFVKFVRFVRFTVLLNLSDIRFVDFCDLKKMGDGPTDGRTDQQTDGQTLL